MTAGKRTPHVLVILNEYAGLTAHTGGVGTRYAALLPALVQQGWKVTALIFVEGDYEPLLSSGGVQIIVESESRRVLRPMRIVLRAMRAAAFVKRTRPDIILAPEWQGFGAFVPKRYPLVTNLVTGMRLINRLTPDRTALLRKVTNHLQIYLEDRQVRRSRYVIAISTAIQKFASDHYGSRLPATTIIRNCIDTTTVALEATRAALPQSWPQAPSQHIVLFVGRIEARKGAPIAAAASRIVAEHVSGVQFIFAGGPGDVTRELSQDDLRDLAGSASADRLHFLGDVRGPSLYRAMAEAELVICPSLWEAFGNVALEAKAAGTPVLVTRGSGFDDFCESGMNAFVCEPGDVQSLANEIIRALGDDSLRAAVVAAASEQIEEFAAASVASEYSALLELALRR